MTTTSERLLALEVSDATRDVLADPTDLLAHVAEDELRDDNGNPDPEEVRAAALALVERTSHLAPRPGPMGEVDQGARPQGPAVFDFAQVLRSAAQ